LPLRQGAGCFFTVPVAPDFYRREGATWLRRYRTWLVAPLVVDQIILTALLVRGRPTYAFYEQFVALVLTTLWFNLTVIQFFTRARALAPAAEVKPATAVQLSLETRRLRDHINWRAEAVILTLVLLTLLLLTLHLFGPLPSHTNQLPESAEDGTGTESHLVRLTVWLLYLQAGLLLLKQVIVRVRMRLPLRRAAEYRRWRAAWQTYHLHVFDAVRLLWALLFCGLLAFETLAPEAGGQVKLLIVTLFVCCVVPFIIYCIRERRRLLVVEREVRPQELVNEFPPAPVAEGRFLAGGLLYLNRDNPVILARSPQGIAINLANRSTYLWVIYLSGLVLLVMWQASH
jgi:hypothetical protein